MTKILRRIFNAASTIRDRISDLAETADMWTNTRFRCYRANERTRLRGSALRAGRSLWQRRNPRAANDKVRSLAGIAVSVAIPPVAESAPWRQHLYWGRLHNTEGPSGYRLLRPVRQGQPGGRLGQCPRSMPLEQGRAGRRDKHFADIEAYGVNSLAQAGDVSNLGP
jgi:hypothetical protein